MQRLPNMMVLDFCEWLREQVSIRQDKEVDLLDIVLNKEYYSRLVKYADEFLSAKGNYPIRALLHRFIDSEEFSECLRHCYNHFRNDNYPKHRIHPKELLRMLLHNCMHCGRCGHCIERFLRHNENNDQEILFGSDISPQDLASYVESAITYEDDPMRVKLLQCLMVNMSVEIDFLEWLLQTQGKPLKIEKMPLVTFEILADEYCDACHKSETDKKQIIRSFKQTGSETLAIKLLSALPKSKWKRMKSIGYIVDRYTNSRVPYKCVILPLSKDADAYRELMGSRYWHDLNDLSGDCLDIFYSQADYGKTGWAIANKLSFLPATLTKLVPSIVIWGEEMGKAQNVSIDDLDNPDIYKVIRAIVEAIQQKKSFTDIVKEANKMAKELREKRRPITNNSLHIEGGNYGTATAGECNHVTTTVINNYNDVDFSKEADVAIDLIRKSIEINEQQKDALVAIVSEAKNAVDKKDEKSQKESKIKFNYFARGLGNTAAKLLSALSAMANLAKFFGLVSP